jgi:arginase
VGTVTRMQINSVPQWQGAVNERAKGIPAGCRALADLAGRILDGPVNHVVQSRETSPIEKKVANRAVLTGANRAAQRAAVAGSAWPILTIGGDCGVEREPLGAARQRFGRELSVVWFDAHPDLNTSRSSPSGAFHGMVLRALLGEGDPDFTASPALVHGQVVLVGTRSIDPAEQAAIERGLAIRNDDPATSLRRSSDLYVHVDLDVLDPSEFGGLNYPEPGGLGIAELVSTLNSLSEFNVIGAGITECTGSPDEVEVLAPIVAAIGNLLVPDLCPRSC